MGVKKNLIGKKICDWTFFFGKYGGRGSSPQENSKKNIKISHIGLKRAVLSQKSAKMGTFGLFWHFFTPNPYFPPRLTGG